MLRRDPRQIPSSWLLLFAAVGLMLLASFCGLMLIEGLKRRDVLLGLLSSLVALCFYFGVLALTGNARQTLRTMTCVIGCGALVTLLALAEFVLFQPFIGERLAGMVAVLIGFWSIPVEGHIVSRVIGQPWFVGIVVAVAAAILQLVLHSMLAGPGSR